MKVLDPMGADANEINRFKELTFTLGRKELQIIESAAKSANRVNAMMMAKMYVPSLPPDQINKFIDWLAARKD